MFRTIQWIDEIVFFLKVPPVLKSKIDKNEMRLYDIRKWAEEMAIGEVICWMGLSVPHPRSSNWQRDITPGEHICILVEDEKDAVQFKMMWPDLVEEE